MFFTQTLYFGDFRFPDLHKPYLKTDCNRFSHPGPIANSCFLDQSCPAFCNPMDCSPPGSSAHGILHARILEWVAVPSSRGSSRPRDWICVSCIAGVRSVKMDIESAPLAEWLVSWPVFFLSLCDLQEGLRHSVCSFKNWTLYLASLNILYYYISRSVMPNSLWPHGLQPTRLHCPWDFPGKRTGVGCYCLLQSQC